MLGTDGRQHFAYELVLTNVTGAPAEIERVEVRAPGAKRPLASIAGAKLVKDMTRPGGLAGGEPPAAVTTIGPNSVAVVWLDVTLAAGHPTPSELLSHVTATLTGPKPFHFSDSLGAVKTGTGAPIALGPPVAGGGTWVADEGCCSEPTHHRRGLAPVNGTLEVPQRFAIDWFELDSHGHAWVGDPKKLTSYVDFGKPEIAAAAGTVVAAVDGIHENKPQGPLEPLPPMAETVGNHVIIKVAPGRYLLYGHMKTGSVRVHAGEHVHLGQVVGELGNTGNSSTPHLHFQVLSTPTFFPADSLPFTFKRFTLLGKATTYFTDETLALRPNGRIAVAASKPAGRERRDQMPLDLTVVRFAGR